MTRRQSPRLAPVLLALVALGAPFAARAADAAPAATPANDAPLLSVETHHQGSFGGSKVRYLARAAEMKLTDADGKPTAAMYYTAYLAENAGADRPVTFVFNGGPGSASMWLHMGLLGPKRVVVASDADTDDGAAPYRVVDNPETLLDLTDLVFIDPIGTGFSHVIGTGRNADFWSMQGDTASIVQFIRSFLTQNHRWNAPKFLFGESFGTTRAASIADALSGDGQDVALSGIVMVSQAMDYTGSSPDPDNLIAHVTYLPTFAATARFHGRAGTDVPLEDWIAQAETFAVDEYLPALFRGSALPDADRRHIAERYAHFTGLPVDYVLRANLRVTAPRFQKELLRDRGLTVGRLDGRYTLDDPDDTADSPRLGDPASAAVSSAFTAAFNAYLDGDLGVTPTRPYLTDNDEVGSNWNYRSVPEGHYFEPTYVKTARALSNALRRNGDLHVLVAAGYYDMSTPFFDAAYTLGRNGILADRIELKHFEAGHMMYLHRPAFDALLKDVRAFYVAHLPDLPHKD